MEDRKNQWPLHLSKCHELANYYLHFNGWNIRILTLEEQINKGYRCTVELKIKYFELCVKGVGSTIGHSYSQGITMKLAFYRACENAFSQVALVLLPHGKVVNVAAIVSDICSTSTLNDFIS